ncbi:3-hydroxyanthranilate 3,4-dioxygenase [Salpingoeca rosetta]|uniref:3-hydroxyanthranilate 3,4-dioxygenase n=1 Tax=Salpingoeca rosetta (strain ATCC 50818 / BSB-021) TaxID=946362 RepID=F2UB69_SALR5|nr:3-hydroxyanthranilate 3,4-dioxygenase [Salpingoeca rosetta]EGD74082.1 3-hydroxyanthranilate 3,4-dioxygenase [Salpingoeca rosetta]|eukprot:XP_004993644.1 3-hydroxyanthranilate 3,4-dioxygenase [Salpingoeca rosetta]
MTLVNIEGWVEENKASFAPPVCNKLMHGDGLLKIMFVGGPNIRRDFHIEEGEELFFQLKGDMVLKIMEQGKPKDVKIKEGEIFVLPGRIPHSPQRFEDTVGLVIERERSEKELDGLRYYRKQDDSTPLWERWFHCYDLGTQLKPVIDEFFASEEHKTDTPTKENVTDPTPINIDTTTTVDAPFSLQQWFEEHADDVADKPTLMFSKGEFQVHACGNGCKASFEPTQQQTWIWQHSGTSTVRVNDIDHSMNQGDSLLIDPNSSVTWTQGPDGRGLRVNMKLP